MPEDVPLSLDSVLPLYAPWAEPTDHGAQAQEGSTAAPVVARRRPGTLPVVKTLRDLFAKGRASMIAPVKSRQRIIDHGEVFTPPGLVNDMLNLVAHECERIDSRFLEPACGDGNFLAAVLVRKLATVDKQNPRERGRWERDAILAVCSMYGIDLLPDNVAACRERLLGIMSQAHAARFNEPLSEAAAKSAAFVLSRNVVQGDALTLLSADGSPIVFSEWSPINGTMVKRRDFKFAHLIGHAEARAHLGPGTLFNDMGEDVYVPEPVGERPPCHYLKLANAEDAK